MSVAKSRLPVINGLTKAIENIISLTDTVSGSTTLSNGQGATFTITTTATSGNRTMTIHDYAIYIGSVSGNNVLPNGASIDMTKWIVSSFTNDWNDTDFLNTVTKVYVQNVSAGASQTVIIEARARFIQNSTTLGGAS